jgi:UDP-GlcNAc:undecaprenyl-phosphate GlcNAc-1-phosphate transferase
MRALAGGIYWKSMGGVVADLLVVVAAFIMAVHLRFGGTPPPDQMDLVVEALPAVVVVKIAIFYAFGLYHGVWRHAGTPELVRLLKASTLASLVTLAGLLAVYGAEGMSLSVVILDWMIVTGGVGSTRFGFRALRQYFAAQRDDGRRVLVYGSGDQGLLVVRHLRQRVDRTVVGLLDEDPERHSLQVQGVQVLGDQEALLNLTAEYDIDEVIVPLEGTSQEERRQIAQHCEKAGVDCQHFAFRLEPAGEDDTLPPVSGDGARIVPSST